MPFSNVSTKHVFARLLRGGSTYWKRPVSIALTTSTCSSASGEEQELARAAASSPKRLPVSVASKSAAPRADDVRDQRLGLRDLDADDALVEEGADGLEVGYLWHAL